MSKKQQFMAQHAAAVRAASNYDEVQKMIEERDEADKMKTLGIRTKCIGFQNGQPAKCIIEVKFDYVDAAIGMYHGDIRAEVEVDDQCNVYDITVNVTPINE